MCSTRVLSRLDNRTNQRRPGDRRRRREIAAAPRATSPAAGAAGDGGSTMTAFPIPGGHKYAEWDAAYVLGSLSEMDRREFEAHLEKCPECSDAVSELSDIPALLSLIDLDAFTDDDDLVALRPPWPQP